jgi:predicted secreted Zn-dependent protease
MGPLNWDAIRVAWDFLQAMSVLLFSAGIWWINRTRASEAAIQRVDARIDEVEKHMTTLEHQVHSLPSRDDIDQMRAEQAKTNQLLARMEATQRAQGQLTDRIHTYMFNNRGS